ncbi:MAG TPA: class I SAM-dependent methyltransferase [Methylocystis sp.]|nr:class I SAM-dependent methyltransferase [Methylocystis sp.]
MQKEQSRIHYTDPKIVASYEKAASLQLCEVEVFNRWLKPGCALLDLGVGAGRTAGPLSQIAGRYVGADVSPAMVEACKRRYPLLDIRLIDATDLSQFSNGEFDAVVFSFNGIDYIDSDEGRARCLKEVARVLTEEGVFIFSCHNAKSLFVLPNFRGAKGIKAIWRALYALGASCRLSARHLFGRAFWSGEGYLHDPADGGMLIYVSTPEKILRQVASAGMKIVDVVGGRFPDTANLYLTPWHYYACQKVGAGRGAKA